MSTAELTRPIKNGTAPGTELAVAPPAPQSPSSSSQVHSLIPRSVDEALRYAQAFARSGMFAVKTPEAALTILLTGMELGMAPAQSMRAFHVIEGKPSPSADTIQALCLARPDICKYFTLVELTDQTATYETWRVGAPEPVRASYTHADAERANLLTKKNWQVNKPQMLAARAKSKLGRLIYPDLTLGLYTPEELTGGEVLDPELASAVDEEERKCLALEEAIGEIIRHVKAGGDAGLKELCQGAWVAAMKESNVKSLAKMNFVQLTGLHSALAAIVARPAAEEGGAEQQDEEDDPFGMTPEEMAGQQAILN